jgi:hypothetical protein
MMRITGAFILEIRVCPRARKGLFPRALLWGDGVSLGGPPQAPPKNKFQSFRLHRFDALVQVADAQLYFGGGPFWSLPNEFLTGFSAAAGIALVTSIGNLGGFVGPYAIGAIIKQTGTFRGGLVFAGISLFGSAMLILVLRKRTEQQVVTAASASD